MQNQSVAPECPASGTFEDWFLNDNPSVQFSQVCQDKLLTLVYDADPSKPMQERFSNQPGVTVKIKDFGKTQSAPFYEPMYAFLEAAGYERNMNIRVAGYDSRLTPDMEGFLQRTIALIEETLPEPQYARPPGGPLKRAALRAVPAHPNLAGVEEQIHPRLHAHGRQLSRAGPLLRGVFHGPECHRLHLSDGPRERGQQRHHVPDPSLQLHELCRPGGLPKPGGGRADRAAEKDYTPQDNIQLFQDAGLTSGAGAGGLLYGFREVR